MDDLDDFECDDFDKTLKVIVVGNGNVGKTSLTTRYAKGRYTGNYKKTIGVDFMEKRLELRDLNATVNLLIWDTAGQEEFGALTSRYYKGAGAVVYVFSTTDRASFDDLFKWQRKVEHECGRIAHVLVQNKIDLVDEAAMTRREVEARADAMRVKLFRACVQDNVNVSEVFEYLARQYLKRGGRDDALEAVTDISTLSSQPSPSYERRSRSGREDSDAGSDGRRGGSSSPSDRASRGRDHERSTGWGSGRLERVDADERGRKNRRNEYDEQDDSDDERRSSRESKDRHRGWDRDDGEDRRGGRERRSERERPRDRDRDRDHDRDRDRSDRDDRRAKDRDRAQGRRHEEWEDRDRERDRGLDRERDRDRGDDRDRDRERRDRGRGRDREHDGGREQDRDRGGRRHREGERERGRSGDRDRETDLKDGDAPNDMKNRSRNRGKDLDDDDCNSDGESIHISDRLGSRKDRGRDEPSSRTKDKMEAERSPSLAHKDDNEPVVKEDSARDTEAEAGSPTASVRSGEFEKNERDSRQNSRSMRESDQVSVKDKKSPSRPQSDKNSEPDAHKPLDKATLRAQLREGQDSDSESEKRNGIKIDGGKASTNASESSRIQPSKRRTNGKKTNPLLYKLSKLVYS